MVTSPHKLGATIVEGFFPYLFSRKVSNVRSPISATENNAEIRVFGRQVSGVIQELQSGTRHFGWKRHIST